MKFIQVSFKQTKLTPGLTTVEFFPPKFTLGPPPAESKIFEPTFPG